MSTISYTREGSGSPLVLIHGIGHHREAWDPVASSLAEHHDVVALDLPGFGRSPRVEPGLAYDMTTTTADLAAFFAELGLQRPHVVGNSLGGAIALELAHRDLVRSATALSPAGFWTVGGQVYACVVLGLIRGAALLPRRTIDSIAHRPAVRAAAVSTLFAHPERLSELEFLSDTYALREATAFGSTMRAGARYRCHCTPTVPTTIAWGAKDRVLLPGQAKRAARAVPGALHVTLPDCGHVPMIDDPDLIVRLVLERTGG